MIVVKTRAQIDKMRQAGILVAQTLDLMERLAKPGVRTIDLDAAAEEFILSGRILKAKELADKMAGVNLTFSMPASEEGKLFGSVGKSDVLTSLKAAGYEVPKNSVRLDAAIKTTGEHEVSLRLQPEVTAVVKVTVTARE